MEFMKQASKTVTSLCSCVTLHRCCSHSIPTSLSSLRYTALRFGFIFTHACSTCPYHGTSFSWYFCRDLPWCLFVLFCFVCKSFSLIIVVFVLDGACHELANAMLVVYGQAVI